MIEQLVKEEERLLGRIKRIQQLTNSLDIGPEDLSQRSLSQARTTVRKLRAIAYVPRIQIRVAPISAEIDQQALTLAQDHLRQSQRKEIDLGVVERVGMPPFIMGDIMRFRQEVLDFRQLPTQDPLLARGMRLYRQDQGIQGEIAEADRPSEEIKLTYADIEQRKIHFGPIQRSLMEQLLPYASTADRKTVQDTLLASDWTAPVWPDVDRAKRLGRLGTHVHQMRATLVDTDFSIENVEPLNASREGRFYLYVHPPIPVTRDTRPPIEEENFLTEKVSPIDHYRGVAVKVWRGMESSMVDTKQFLADFLGSEDAYSFLNYMLRFSRRLKAGKLSKEEENLFYQLASGNLTEWLAFRHLYPRYLAEGVIMLSPDQMSTLYSFAHSEKDVKKDQFGINWEIEGDVPSPDSLLIRIVPQEAPNHLEIVSVVEVKNVTNESPEILEYMDRQHARYTPKDVAFYLKLNEPRRALRLGRLIRKLVPSLHDDFPLTVNDEMEVIYVVPIDAPRLQIRNIKPPEFFPVTSGEIAGLVRMLPGILN